MTLSRAPKIVKQVFDILDLIFIRAFILALALVGAYALLSQHLRH